MTGRNYIITGEIIMIYYVSANAAGCSYGTAANPFHTITEAARIAQPGDEVIVAPGIYREYVNPLYGGTDDAPPDHLSFRDASGGCHQPVLRR